MNPLSKERAMKLCREMVSLDLMSTSDGTSLMQLLQKANEPEASVVGDLLTFIIRNQEAA